MCRLNGSTIRNNNIDGLYGRLYILCFPSYEFVSTARVQHDLMFNDMLEERSIVVRTAASFVCTVTDVVVGHTSLIVIFNSCQATVTIGLGVGQEGQAKI